MLLTQVKYCDWLRLAQISRACQNLWFLAIIWNIQCYQEVAICITYMQLGWRYPEKPECLACHNILYLPIPGQSNSSVYNFCQILCPITIQFHCTRQWLLPGWLIHLVFYCRPAFPLFTILLSICWVYNRSRPGTWDLYEKPKRVKMKCPRA